MADGASRTQRRPCSALERRKCPGWRPSNSRARPAAISAMVKSAAATVMSGGQRTLTDVVTTNASVALVTEVALRSAKGGN